MYTIYRTPGIILQSIPIGEASRYLSIFTREFGRVGVFAQGVREMKSKLRYHLEDYSYTEIEMIEGKHGWKITNAEESVNYGRALLGNDTPAFEIIVKMIRLLERLLRGEEANRALFDDTVSGFSLMFEQKIPKEHLHNFEIILVMRILSHLGYWGNNQIPDAFLQKDLAHPNLLQEISYIKSIAIQEINKSLKATQL